MSANWHLAIECSSVGGSVALFRLAEDNLGLRLHSQIVLATDRGSVCTLAPAIEEIFKAVKLHPQRLENLSVTVGPGSFTGLRVGLATVKMLGMACRKEIIPVDTLAAIAVRFASAHTQLLQSPCRLVTAINAFRKQVFTASWIVDHSGPRLVRPATVVDARDWLGDPWGVITTDDNHSSAEQADLWITGGALGSYPIVTAQSNWRLAAADIWQPMAEQVGQLGWQGYLAGQQVSAKELAPNYIRASAAEEKARKVT